MELISAITSAKATFELLSGALKARDESKAAAAAQALHKELLAMSDLAFTFVERSFALVEANAALKLAHAENKRVVMELENRLLERDSYLLHELVPGVFVYAYQPAAQGREHPPHYLCQPCYDNGKKRVFRYGQSAMFGPCWSCAEQESHTIYDPKPKSGRSVISAGL